MQHLITSGCSFTREETYDTWADYLARARGATLHNVGMSGCGNHVIAAELIRKIEGLRSQDIPVDDMYVVVQWSSIFRFDRIVPVELGTTDRRVWLANGAASRAWIPPDSENDWLMTAGSTKKGIWPHVFAVTSPEQAFMETVENILRVQWYLKLHNIKYKMFTGWDIFHVNDYHQVGDDIMVGKNQFGDVVYNNKGLTHMCDAFKWAGYLFNMIDKEHFWTYNSDAVKEGGLTQYTRENLPGSWCRSRVDIHPTDEAHELFALEVLDKIIDDD